MHIFYQTFNSRFFMEFVDYPEENCFCKLLIIMILGIKIEMPDNGHSEESGIIDFSH